MNKNLLIMGGILIGLFVISFLSILIFTLPSISWTKDLTGNHNANIATTISGITTPILSAITIYFLYVAFTKQKESNEMQVCKNNADLIFSLLEQVNNDYQLFSVKSEDHAQTYNGNVAMIKIANKVVPQRSIDGFLSTAYSDDLLYILTSLELINKQIKDSKLEKPIRDLLKTKYEKFVFTKLYFCLHAINSQYRTLYKNEPSLKGIEVYFRFYDHLQTV